MEQQGVDAIESPAAAGAYGYRRDWAVDCASQPPSEEAWLHAGWRRDLRRTIVRRVLPRLATASCDMTRPGGVQRFPAEAVAQFATAALSTSLRHMLGLIDGFRAEGTTLESIFLDLLSPAARRLGDLWLADELSFFDVTAGLGRLQALVRTLGPNFEGRFGGSAPTGRILLAPVRGEPHIFGLSIVAAFFRRAGWDVTFEPAGITEMATARLRAGAFDVVGLSAGADAAFSRLPSDVAVVRSAAGRREIAVIVGGPAFLDDPELGRKVGADAAARDATEAVQLGSALHRRYAAA